MFAKNTKRHWFSASALLLLTYRQQQHQSLTLLPRSSWQLKEWLLNHSPQYYYSFTIILKQKKNIAFCWGWRNWIREHFFVFFFQFKFYTAEQADEFLKAVPKECLPEDYGGDLPKLNILCDEQKKWLKKMLPILEPVPKKM